MTGPSLVVVATGSSGAIILPSYLSEIRDVVGGTVTVVLTHTAQRFVSPEVVGWFADRVVTPDTPGVNPIELAVQAAHVVVLPATGNALATVALGLMPTQATTLLAAAGRPCLYFPHMHENVWRRPVMAQHVRTLRAEGHVVVEPQPVRGYQLSAQQTTTGLSMPAPEEAAELVRTWTGASLELSPA